MSGSYKEVFDNILLDLAKLRNIRKDSADYLESCNQIVSKLEATLADISGGAVLLDGNDKALLEEIALSWFENRVMTVREAIGRKRCFLLDISK